MSAPGPVFHLVTCEYPPDVGGVGDHTHALATVLAAAGECVHVWCPGSATASKPGSPITVHALPGRFGPDALRVLQRGLDETQAPRRLFVQWVPHGYGRRAINLPFCAWVLRRARLDGDRVDVMIHEPYLAFDRYRVRQSGAAAFHRVMLATLMAASTTVWLATPSFEPLVRPYGFGRPLGYRWLPLPSPLEPTANEALIARIGARWRSPVVAHFGMFNPLVTGMLAGVIEQVARQRPDVTWLLIGRGSERFAGDLATRLPHLANALVPTGTLDADTLSAHLFAADVFVQPYPDGVTARRTTATALLAHERPIVTTSGYLTESFWRTDGGVQLTPAGDPAALAAATLDLMRDGAARANLAAAGRAMFARRFSITEAVAALIGAGPNGSART